VSPTVASDLGKGDQLGILSPVLAERQDEVVGIQSGLDYAVFNPATDPSLTSRFDAEDPSNKGSSKTELVRAQGMLVDSSEPLVVALTESEGEAAALEPILAQALKAGAAFVTLGSAGAALLEMLESERRRFEARCAHAGPLDDAVLRRACASADLLLLPRAYDRDAFAARVAQRYGAVPVAVAAGAITDVVVDCDAHLETGTGFLADSPAADELGGALARGLAAYRSPRWSSLRRRVMRLDLAWDRPARRYVQVYRQAVEAAKAREGA
jgi:starch synthase